MRKSNDPGWAWFDQTMGNQDPSPEDLPARFARCFAGQDGEVALAHLAEMTLSRPLGPKADDGVLRHLEGQRFLVSYIMGLVRQGRHT